MNPKKLQEKKMVKVDFSEIVGKIKPMNAVNNGPSREVQEDQIRSNFIAYKKARIPYARNHDAAFCSSYGGEHTVDISAVFPNFDADETDEKNYDFFYTDEYVKNLLAAGTETYYRLGTKIEHGHKKYGTIMPKDFGKWARICERIVAHYNEGWADGFHYNIQYWEIWNEPDLDENEPPHRKRTWSGTRENFFDFYEIAAKHLKGKFPALKIGGPAVAWNMEWAEDFLKTMHEREVPIDFFSWHTYGKPPSKIVEYILHVRKILDKNGYIDTESHCNEWNYLIDWMENYVRTIEHIRGERGAAFSAAVMNAAQYAPLDMLMYYDARLTTPLNGLFSLYTLRPLKGYYPFYGWGILAELSSCVKTESDDARITATGAVCGEKAGILLSFFDEDEYNDKEEEVQIRLEGLPIEKGEIYLTDKTHTFERTAAFKDGEFSLRLAPNSVAFIALNGLEIEKV